MNNERADVKTIRGHNLGVVLRALRMHGPLSRVELARESGLVHASMTNLVADLSSRGLVRSVGSTATKQGPGRPATPVELAPSRAFMLATHVTEESIDAELVSNTGLVAWARHQPLTRHHTTPESVAGAIAGMVLQAIDYTTANSAVLVGAAVAMAGPVDPAAGEVIVAIDFGWGRVPLIQLIRAAGVPDDVPLLLTGDASAGAMAEFQALDLPRPKVMLYIKADTGVGGGVVIEGVDFADHAGFGGGIGHVTVDWNGRPCACGSVGCVATYAGPEPLMDAAGLRDVLDGDGIGVAIRTLCHKALCGDKAALDAIDCAAQAVAVGVRSSCELFGPGVIVLGGYLAQLQQWIEPRLLQQIMPGGYTKPFASHLQIRAGRLGARAALVGAAALGFEPLFADPSIVPVLDATA